jgi:hypothetical protein
MKTAFYLKNCSLALTIAAVRGVLHHNFQPIIFFELPFANFASCCFLCAILAKWMSTIKDVN